MAGDQLTAPDGAGDGTGTSGETGSALARVSGSMMRIYKEQFGRGPGSARSHYAGPDTIICVLRDSLTPVERSMRGMGEHQRLRDIRMLFQYATEERFRAAVEEATGRRVVSFMSGVDVDEDVACEIFILDPVKGAS